MHSEAEENDEVCRQNLSWDDNFIMSLWKLFLFSPLIYFGRVEEHIKMHQVGLYSRTNAHNMKKKIREVRVRDKESGETESSKQTSRQRRPRQKKRNARTIDIFCWPLNTCMTCWIRSRTLHTLEHRTSGTQKVLFFLFISDKRYSSTHFVSTRIDVLAGPFQKSW